MVLQRLHGVLQLIWRAGELPRSASSHFYCLSLNVFVVDMIIVTRECAESDLVQDFVTFHVFFDFEHIPEQVCSQWQYYNHCHKHRARDYYAIFCNDPSWWISNSCLARSHIGNPYSTNDKTAMHQKKVMVMVKVMVNVMVKVFTNMLVLLLQWYHSVKNKLLKASNVTPRQWWACEQKQRHHKSTNPDSELQKAKWPRLSSKLGKVAKFI